MSRCSCFQFLLAHHNVLGCSPQRWQHSLIGVLHMH
uniref:Uncharacterized protein n=1 Tax=Arundo donax TaxID=35708 RepID=A0A0A9BG25_ARUDO